MNKVKSNLKKARRISVKPFEELHLKRSDFSPAEFHVDAHNHKHILSYSPSSLFSYGFVNPKGSTSNWGLWLRTLVMCGVATIAANYPCATKNQHWTFCFPVIASGEGLIFASLVAFLLGLFTSTTFSRWWSIREKLGIVMNSTTNLHIILNTCLAQEPEFQESAKRIIRWMHLAHTLVYKHANHDDDLGDLVESELATNAEVNALSKYKDLSMPAIVYHWCMTELHPLTTKITPVAAIAASLGYVTGCLNAAHEISAFLKTQIPYMYLHLLAFTTKVHLCFVVLYSAGIIQQGITGELWTRIMLGYTVIITNNVIYEGLLRIHEMLHNPLGDDHADFPTNLYVSETFTIGGSFCPPPKGDEKGKDSFSLEVMV